MEWHQWYPHIIKNKYAEFSGVATRPEFWFWQLSCFSIGLGLFFLSALVPILGLLLLLHILFVFIPTLAVGARRLHDMGQSGHMQWLVLVPLGNIALLVLWCQPTKVNTKYSSIPSSFGQQTTSNPNSTPPAILDGPTPGSSSVTPPGVTEPTSSHENNISRPVQKERPIIYMNNEDERN